ncbi:glycosyltransferase involved in cell wall biosynthesis [Scopulibacillus darangshiensis]|uniref:Glycosyltransferase involved in cell wall biosynthesis n=1 Tax=Scopulibacillus darangshiensis TaxID=442528 RepID=A0A4R2N9Q0_9BACL|nr:glycosyltransferase family 4 protein [Scopulibacillus darangshiensis]TCP17655.1 glycosyltransferase involved in cell wall biosynthesis [Scopulibacillus darangshiensis]
MKINFLIFDIFGMGGTVRTVLNVANYLAENDYDVEIISVFQKRNQPFFEIDPRIKVTILHDSVNRQKKPKKLMGKIGNRLLKLKSRLIHKDDEAHHVFSLLTDLKMYSYIKSLESGILITTRPSFNIFAAKYAKPGVKLIGQEHLNFGVYSDDLKKAITTSYGKLDYLVTLTDDDTSDYKSLFSNKKVRVRKITNSVPKFEGNSSKLDEKVVIAAGRLAPQKGFDLLIDSFTTVIKTHPDWKLKIFGYGRDKAELQQLILDKKVYNNVILMGPTKEMEKELSKASIYALSSRFEGFGMVIVEAMQCGVPVVSFDCPKGPAEIISHNKDGILVKNGDIDALASSLIDLINNEEKRKVFGKNALVNVKRFEIDNIGRLWLELLGDINGIKKAN